MEDNGIGMNKEEKENLFKLFGTMKNDKYTNLKGIGLGLCISKMIVESFGGKILVHSEPNKGSQFTFRFYIEKEEKVDSSDDSEEQDEVRMLSEDNF